MGITPKYYECHITIDPVFNAELAQFKALSSVYLFRVADLVMLKGKNDAGEPSQKDSFCTGRDGEFDALYTRMNGLLTLLRSHGFVVRRFKIEAVLIDERRK